MEDTQRQGEYRSRGDYHRELDPDWSYAPVYRRKVELTDRFVARLEKGARLLDVGCGEGALVDRYRGRSIDAVGVDAYYQSEHVQKASLLALPFADGSFEGVLCLDVLEHLSFLEQPRALGEIARVLCTGGRLLLSVPNLANLHSRLRFVLFGRLTRTSAIERHPGDRPIAEYLQMLERSGFRTLRRQGIFPTLPFFFRLVNRKAARYGWLVPVLDRVLPLPSLCFLNVVEAERPR
jgi:SAM-dependent methyltransferase